MLNCQLFLTMLLIIHRLDLGKFLPCPPDAVFAMDPQITSLCGAVEPQRLVQHKLRIQ
jgi:hypothetical protein